MNRMGLGREVAVAVISVLVVGGCAMDSVNLPTATMSDAVTAATFTVLSYNVDGLPAILQDGGHPEVTTPIIGQKIRGYDIVNVEEDFNSHTALYANDDHPFRTATSGAAGIGSGLNTLSRFPFSDDIDRVTWTVRSNTDGNNLTPKGLTLAQRATAAHGRGRVSRCVQPPHQRGRIR